MGVWFFTTTKKQNNQAKNKETNEAINKNNVKCPKAKIKNIM